MDTFIKTPVGQALSLLREIQEARKDKTTLLAIRDRIHSSLFGAEDLTNNVNRYLRRLEAS